MSIPTLLRKAEHAALSRLTLSGSVLDLGGDTRSDYRNLFQGEYSITTVNLDEKAKPDIVHDLEEPLPVADASYDHVLLINVLEHVFSYRELLQEAVRVVRPGGSIIIVVPFMFPIHPSPRDYWRFSKDALKRICEEAGLTSITITPLGSGVFASRSLMLDRLMPLPIRTMFWLGRPIVFLSDWIMRILARALGKRYKPEDYPLGYIVSAINARTSKNL